MMYFVLLSEILAVLHRFDISTVSLTADENSNQRILLIDILSLIFTLVVEFMVINC